MAFTNQKLIDLNIFYYIKEQILFSLLPDTVSFEEEVKDDTMTSIDIIHLNIKEEEHRAYQASNRNWIYFGDSSMNVIIKKNGFEIDSANYTINYNDGIIVFTQAFSATLDNLDDITADYYYLQIEIVDGYPYEKIDKSDLQNNLPVVAVEYMDGYDEPYELGGTEEELRSFSIHVFGTSNSERDDLSGIIKNGFKHSIPVIDYREGMPLNFDGTKNDDFQPVTLEQRVQFENVRDKVVRLQNPKSYQRFWSIITLTARSFI